MAIRHLKCKFCDYKTPFNYRLKSGKFCGPEKAHARMNAHCEERHRDIYEKIQEKLDHDFPQEEN